MTNLRELFTEYHAGFQDFVPWLDHHIEMHRRHPLECAEFGAEWLRRWEAVGRLFHQRAEMRELIKGKWCVSLFIGHRLTTVSDYIVKAQELHNAEGCGLRVILLDGTIIREWGPK